MLFSILFPKWWLVIREIEWKNRSLPFIVKIIVKINFSLISNCAFNFLNLFGFFCSAHKHTHQAEKRERWTLYLLTGHMVAANIAIGAPCSGSDRCVSGAVCDKVHGKCCKYSVSLVSKKWSFMIPLNVSLFHFLTLSLLLLRSFFFWSFSFLCRKIADGCKVII